MFIARMAALAEVLFVLALGNVLGETLYGLIAPTSVRAGEADDMTSAVWSGVLILMRLGLAGAFGYLLLYLRRGLKPGQAGLSLGGHSIGDLVGRGFVPGLVSSFLVALLFAVQALVPLGAGLPAWESYGDRAVDTAFLVNLLATAILIPPLAEEIMARGYFRVRLVESYGMMSGVVLTALVFGLSHARYLQLDGMLLSFMAVLLINSLMWTYLAQQTGSVIPSMVAHAMTNGVGTAVLFNVWFPLVVVTIGLLVFVGPIGRVMTAFLQDWKRDPDKHSFWQGLAIIVAILVLALASLEFFGRSPTLIMLGAITGLITVWNLISFRVRASGRVEMRDDA